MTLLLTLALQCSLTLKLTLPLNDVSVDMDVGVDVEADVEVDIDVDEAALTSRPEYDCVGSKLDASPGALEPYVLCFPVFFRFRFFSRFFVVSLPFCFPFVLLLFSLLFCARSRIWRRNPWCPSASRRFRRSPVLTASLLWEALQQGSERKRS